MSISSLDEAQRGPKKLNMHVVHIFYGNCGLRPFVGEKKV